jgi:hypothetical protein
MIRAIQLNTLDAYDSTFVQSEIAQRSGIPREPRGPDAPYLVS